MFITYGVGMFSTCFFQYFGIVFQKLPIFFTIISYSCTNQPLWRTEGPEGILSFPPLNQGVMICMLTAQNTNNTLFIKNHQSKHYCCRIFFSAEWTLIFYSDQVWRYISNYNTPRLQCCCQNATSKTYKASQLTFIIT